MSKKIYEALGLTEARADELITLIKPDWLEFTGCTTPFGDILAKVCDRIAPDITPRELTFVISHLTGHCHMAKSPLSQLMTLTAMRRE